MRLGKIAWLILIAGLLVITFGGLGATRSQQMNEQKKALEELAIAETRLNQFQIKQLTSQQESLELQLTQSGSQLTVAKTALVQPNQSIPVIDTVFNIAAACGVQVIQIGSSSLGAEALGAVPCSTLPLSATVGGDVSKLIDFIIALDNDFTTGTVKSAQLIIPVQTNNSTVDLTSTANIQMIVYSYSGG